MTPNHIRTIRKEAGLSQTGLAAILRIKDLRTIRRWEKGEIPITGPASIILELIEADALPHKYYEAAGVKVPRQQQWTSNQIARAKAENLPPKPINKLDPMLIDTVRVYRTKYGSDENKRVSEMVETLFALPYVALADSDGDGGE